MLRRVDAWLSEFGVASAALELNGRKYEMTKSLERGPRANLNRLEGVLQGSKHAGPWLLGVVAVRRP